MRSTGIDPKTEYEYITTDLGKKVLFYSETGITSIVKYLDGNSEKIARHALQFISTIYVYADRSETSRAIDRFGFGWGDIMEDAVKLYSDIIKDKIMITLFHKLRVWDTYDASSVALFGKMSSYFGWKATFSHANKYPPENTQLGRLNILNLFKDHIMEFYRDITPDIFSLLDIHDNLTLKQDFVEFKSIGNIMRELFREVKENGEDFNRLVSVYAGILNFSSGARGSFYALLYMTSHFHFLLSQRSIVPNETFLYVYNALVEKYENDDAVESLYFLELYRKALKFFENGIKKRRIYFVPTEIFNSYPSPKTGSRYVTVADCSDTEDFMGNMFQDMDKKDLVSIRLGDSITQCFERETLVKALLKSQYVFANEMTVRTVSRAVSHVISLFDIENDDQDISAIECKMNYLFDREDISSEQRAIRDVVKYLRLYKFPWGGNWLNADALYNIMHTAHNRYALVKVDSGMRLTSINPHGIGSIHGRFDVYTIFPETEEGKPIYKYTSDDLLFYLSGELFKKAEKGIIALIS